MEEGVMSVVELLDRAQELGATFTVPGPGRLHVSASDPLPNDLVRELTDNKPEIIEYLQKHTSLMDLPWPIGYGGLPADEVARGEASNDRLGVDDPVARRLNVLMWLWSHYRDQGDVEMASEMRQAYHELRHADKSLIELCGLCEYQDRS
jgi:hypothetical protein